MCNNTLTYINLTKEFVKQAEDMVPDNKEDIEKVRKRR